MGSLNAENVAYDVLKKVSLGKLVNKKEIILKRGYAKTIAKAPTKVTKTKSYQSIISPVVRQMELARDKALEEINNKDLSKVQYYDLIQGINKLSHDIQILTGGATENIAVKPLATLEELQG